MLNVLFVICGVVLGLIFGALPGLTVTMTTVLVVSLTYGWDMIPALAFIVGAYIGGVVGGSISAITLNIPGTCSAVATGFDGNPLTHRGEANKALSISLFVSLIGGIFGLIFLWIFGPIMGSFALKFGSQEFFLLALWGILLTAILSEGNLIKGIISACFGLFICMIGMDPQTGALRYTLGSGELVGGIDFTIALVGLFGMKEVFVQLSNKDAFSDHGVRFKFKDLLPNWKVMKPCWKTLTWSSIIGSIIGVLPGAGGDIGALVSYGVTKQIVKKPSRPFGQGAYEGVAAPEVANDSAVGGSMATMFTLGIPGDGPTAIVLGAFYMHGLIPGPTFMSTGLNYFHSILVFMLIAIVAAYFIGLVGSNGMLKVLRLPRWLLVALISMLCIVGAYSIQKSLTDVMIMVIFGFIGYLMEEGGFPTSPAVLAIILGELLETKLRQAAIISGGWDALLLSFVQRPLCIVLLVLMVASFALQKSVKGAQQ